MYPHPMQRAGSGTWGTEISQGNVLEGHSILTVSLGRDRERGMYSEKRTGCEPMLKI